MTVLEKIRERAKEVPQRLVFPEGEDPRVIEAAIEINKEKFAQPVILGNEDKIHQVGKEQDFEDKFAAVIDALNAADGHTNSTLWKDVSDDASYLITSEWSEEQAFTDFIRSDAFRAVTNWGKEQILSGRPQHKIYRQ